jgi:hypothetical protein
VPKEVPLMRRVLTIIVVSLAGGAGLAWADTTPKPGLSPQEEASIAATAQPVIATARANLREALVSAMRSGGPEKAVEACHVAAPGITSGSKGQSPAGPVIIGRSALKLRNPANAPEPWLKPLLDELARAPKSPAAKPRVVVIDAQTAGYVEPIYVDSPCLKCHGAQPEGGLGAKLAQLYPQDKATGFAEGDFRGVFWAKVPRGK